VPASELPSPPSLNDVACKYLERSDSNRNSMYMRLSIIMDEAVTNLRAPQPLRQLAEITDFNLFLTTAFDPLMESALNEVRKKETQSLSYSPSDPQDLPAARDLSRPTVYHLFGTSDVSPTYAISREDLLEWFYAMESKPRPTEFCEIKGRKNLHRFMLLVIFKDHVSPPWSSDLSNQTSSPAESSPAFSLFAASRSSSA
jgi:hypothetical protein